MPALFTRQGLSLLLEYALTNLLTLGVLFLALRHYAPLEYGLVAKLQAEVAIFAVLLTLALDAPLLNRLAEPDDRGALLGTALGLRGAGLVLTFAACLATSLATGQPAEVALPWLVLVLLPQAISAANVFSILLFHENALTALVPWRMGVTVLAAGARVSAVYMGASYAEYLALAIGEALLLLGLTYAFYRERHFHLRLAWDASLARELLAEAWPLVLSSFVVALFFKLDLVIVSAVLPFEKVAVYSVAQRIVEIYAAALAILLMQYYVQLAKRSPEDQRSGIARLFKLGYLLVLGTVGVHYLVVAPLLNQFLGAKYAEGVALSGVLCGSLLVTVAGTVRGYLFIFEGLNKYHVPSALIGVAVLGVTAYPATQAFGLTGAALSLILAQAASLGLSTLVFPALRAHAGLYVGRAP